MAGRRNILNRLHCNRMGSRLVDLAEGTLGERQRRRLESHVSRCSRCAEELASLREIPEALRASEGSDRDEAFWIGQRNLIMAAVEPLPARRSRRAFSLRLPSWQWATAAATLAVVAAVVGYRVVLKPPVTSWEVASDLSDLEAETVVALLEASSSLFPQVDVLPAAESWEAEVWGSLAVQGWDPRFADPPGIETLSDEEFESAVGLVGVSWG